MELGDCVPRLLARRSLGRETARRLTSFCHWLISRPHVRGRKLEVHMRIRHYMPHDSYGIHTLAERVTGS